ncbi:probable 4-coumarate--CoA ligase 1 [Daphnia pulex]|uniref:probable 4-coumarate--CoA ligase 1 n=1 Tax=Daphnia pulex TaxID=6669 RepID=UPI001EDEB975|nr:probable 4-coumarate--CoA ligase 1 [Daphnia pulex]
MSLHLRSTLQRALLLANQTGTAQKAALCNVPPSPKYKPMPDVSKFENNIVTSPYGECEFHDMTMVQKVFESASRWPNKIAMECGITGRKYTYEMMRQLIRRFGSALTRMGYKKDEVFGIISPNIPEFPIVLYGASGAGMPVSLVNPTFTAEEMARQLSAVGATALFGVAPMAETLKQVAGLCPAIRHVILLGPPQEGAVCFQQMVQDSGDLFNETPDINVKEDVFLLPHSSGTSGLPKSVMLTHFNMTSNVMQFLQPGGTNHQFATTNYQDTYVCLLPFFHTYGITIILNTGIQTGAKLVTLPQFDVQSYFKAIDDHKPTAMHIVPPLASLLIQYPGLKLESFSRAHTVFCGAAPLSAQTTVEMLERLNVPNLSFQEGYGLSETSPGIMMSPLGNVKLGSCGSPIPWTRAKIVDHEIGDHALGPYQQGELYVAGPQVMKGYLNNPKATEEMIDEEGWLRTGDVAYYDEGGNFYIVDRLKELIKVKGFQVAPAELEDILASHPAVAEAAVIGIPDEQAGELPRAYVVKKPGMESVSDAEIRAFVDSKVSSHKQIKGGIEFRSAIPKNNMGKILRRILRDQFAEKNK